MRTLIIALLAFAPSASGAPAAPAPPTREDLDFARVRFIHEATGVGGMAHCARFDALRCTRSRRDPAEFSCVYREVAPGGLWVRKSAVLRKAEADWRWVSGDPPRCSIVSTP